MIGDQTYFRGNGDQPQIEVSRDSRREDLIAPFTHFSELYGQYVSMSEDSTVESASRNKIRSELIRAAQDIATMLLPENVVQDLNLQYSDPSLVHALTEPTTTGVTEIARAFDCTQDEGLRRVLEYLVQHRGEITNRLCAETVQAIAIALESHAPLIETISQAASEDLQVSLEIIEARKAAQKIDSDKFNETIVAHMKALGLTYADFNALNDANRVRISPAGEITIAPPEFDEIARSEPSGYVAPTRKFGKGVIGRLFKRSDPRAQPRHRL